MKTLSIQKTINTELQPSYDELHKSIHNSLVESGSEKYIKSVDKNY